MVRQVYIAQKMTPVGMIMYKKIIRENTFFVKKILAKKFFFSFSPFLREIAIQLSKWHQKLKLKILLNYFTSKPSLRVKNTINW